MLLRSLVATLALLSPSCAHPRAALVTGTVIGILGGAVMATTHVRDCTSRDASELCGFDQQGDKLKQDTGAVIVLGGVALIFAGLAGLSDERTGHPAPLGPTAPAVPRTRARSRRAAAPGAAAAP